MPRLQINLNPEQAEAVFALAEENYQKPATFWKSIILQHLQNTRYRVSMSSPRHVDQVYNPNQHACVTEGIEKKEGSTNQYTSQKGRAQ